MDENLRRAIEADCAKLMTRSVVLLDNRKYEPLADLFGDAGEWVRGGKSFRGSAAIMGSLEERATDMVIRHVLSTIDVTVHNSDHADGIGYFLVFKATGDGAEPALPAPLTGPVMVAEMRDQYRRLDGVWRIHKRETARIFQ